LLLGARARVRDWRGYDSVAENYDRLWGPRFEAAAGHLLAFAPPTPGSRLLDLGTGTGAVASALGDTLHNLTVVGCDLSRPMLTRARRQIPRLRTVQADATLLPFRGGRFDLVTANCVLSHVRDFRQALAESLRVLSRPGRLALSSWGPASDPYAAAWEELLAAAVGPDALARAIEAVTPWASRFSTVETVRADLLEAGFSRISTETVAMDVRCRVDEYLAERQLGAAGRFGRRALGRDRWRTFLERAADQLRHRFGDQVGYARTLIVGAAYSAPSFLERLRRSRAFT
jgi:ubiquinone/menaquinone biosynthesis C-methylase UbiE